MKRYSLLYFVIINFLFSAICYAKNIQVLIFSASLSENSATENLVDKMISISKNNNVIFNKIDLKKYITIDVNTDYINKNGLPQAVGAFSALVKDTDAIIISTPEYNGSFPGHLKTIIDLASMYDGKTFKSKPILLVSASSGKFGGLQGLINLRQPLSNLGAYVYPNLLAVQSQNNKISVETNEYIIETLNEFFAFSKLLSTKDRD